MATEYCKNFCTPSPTTQQYDVLDLDEAFCQGGEQVRDAMIEEIMLRLRAFNAGTGLNDYTLIHTTKEYHDGIRVVKLMFNEKFFEELEKRLKGGAS